MDDNLWVVAKNDTLAKEEKLQESKLFVIRDDYKKEMSSSEVATDCQSEQLFLVAAANLSFYLANMAGNLFNSVQQLLLLP